MRIDRLDLLAIGPFTGKTLDLSPGAEGLHLIYGDNERGKTSALRALGQLFFGIPATSPDNFIHRYDKMRVGAAIVRRDGERLDFIRRKGNKATLLSIDEKTPIDDGELQKFLGGCDRVTFEQMFGIDHRSLVEGGQAIARGQGDVGELLFAAGAGISDLRSIAASLEKKADDLFKPAGSNPKINKLLAKWKEATRQLRDSQMPSNRWGEHKKALESAQSELHRSNEQLQQATQQSGRLRRVRDALPVVAAWKRMREQLANYADAPRLSTDFADARRDASASLDAHRTMLRGIDEEIARIKSEAAAQSLPEALLARAEQIEKQKEELGAYRKAEKDRRRLTTELAEKTAAARQQLHGLRPDLNLDQAASLKLSGRKKVELAKLAERFETLQEDIEQAAATIAASERDGKMLADELAEHPAACDPSLLAEAIAAIQSEGPIERQAGELRSKIAQAQRQIGIEFNGLRKIGGGLAGEIAAGTVAGGNDFDAFAQLPLPSPETLERFERASDAHEKKINRTTDAQQLADESRLKLAQRLDQLRAAGDLPSDDDLTAARDKRDRLWQLIRTSWLKGSIDTRAAAELIEGISGNLHPSDLADAFQRHALDADSLVDRLRREAERVAELVQATREHSVAERRAGEATRQLQADQADRDRTEYEWRACWQPAGIAALPPREMKFWLARHKTFVQQGHDLADLVAALAQLDARLADQRAIVARQLQRVDCDVETNNTSLTELMAQANVTVKNLIAQAAVRRELTNDIRQEERTLQTARQNLAKAEGDLNAWRDQWAKAVAQLELGRNQGVDDATGELAPQRVAEFIVGCDELFKLLDVANTHQARIDAIVDDAQRFRAEVERLLAAIDQQQSPGSIEPEAAVEGLAARLQRAKADERDAERGNEELRRQVEKRQTASDEITRLESLLSVHCREAGCKTPDELPAVEQRAAEAVALRDQLAARESELLLLGRGMPLESLVAEVESTAGDEITPQLEQLEREIAGLQEQCNARHQTIGVEKSALAAMDASAAAAQAAEEEQQVLAELETNVASYLRLRLASAVLDQGIERYRKKTEGPVLSRASRYFARLTVGSFDGIDVDHDKQQIVGARGDDRIPPEAMSEGSCDQLYLALRLASLEEWLTHHEPWPLIVDDILISFDDRRSAAALEVLAELSQKTQVIFFAHHRHLLEIAAKVVPGDKLFVHYL